MCASMSSMVATLLGPRLGHDVHQEGGSQIPPPREFKVHTRDQVPGTTAPDGLTIASVLSFVQSQSERGEMWINTWKSSSQFSTWHTDCALEATVETAGFFRQFSLTKKKLNEVSEDFLNTGAVSMTQASVPY